jgi:hypothetical protein
MARWICECGPDLSSGLAPGVAYAFLVFWLAGWTVAGVWALYLVYRAFRPSVPETLKFMPNGVTYDSGVPAFQMYFGYASHKEVWKYMFPRRTRVELDRRKLQSLRLRETNEGNRLTVDADALRLDIVPSASEIEREWLYELLAKRYSLPLPQKDRNPFSHAYCGVWVLSWARNSQGRRCRGNLLSKPYRGALRRHH